MATIWKAARQQRLWCGTGDQKCGQIKRTRKFSLQRYRIFILFVASSPLPHQSEEQMPCCHGLFERPYERFILWLPERLFTPSLNGTRKDAPSLAFSFGVVWRKDTIGQCPCHTSARSSATSHIVGKESTAGNAEDIVPLEPSGTITKITVSPTGKAQLSFKAETGSIMLHRAGGYEPLSHPFLSK